MGVAIPESLVNITTTAPTADDGPLAKWSPKTCSQCGHADWERVVSGSPQIAYCNHPLTKQFSPPREWVEPDEEACPEFERRPSTRQILGRGGVDLMKQRVPMTAGERVVRFEKNLDGVLRLLIFAICGIDILINLVRILFKR
jgi:hypothetical protein